jgi:hypothetical protein
MVGILTGFVLPLGVPASVPNSQLARPLESRSRFTIGWMNAICGIRRGLPPRSRRP